MKKLDFVLQLFAFTVIGFLMLNAVFSYNGIAVL